MGLKLGGFGASGPCGCCAYPCTLSGSYPRNNWNLALTYATAFDSLGRPTATSSANYTLYYRSGTVRWYGGSFVYSGPTWYSGKIDIPGIAYRIASAPYYAVLPSGTEYALIPGCWVNTMGGQFVVGSPSLSCLVDDGTNITWTDFTCGNSLINLPANPTIQGTLVTMSPFKATFSNNNSNFSFSGTATSA